MNLVSSSRLLGFSHSSHYFEAVEKNVNNFILSYKLKKYSYVFGLNNLSII